MGNCVFKGLGVADQGRVIKVVTPNGGVMELQTPITAESITNEFPGHGIFLSPSAAAAHHYNNTSPPPLHHHEQLSAGKSYYLLPLLLQDHMNHAVPDVGLDTPYRMSVDGQQGTSLSFKRQSAASAAAAAAAAAFPSGGSMRHQQGVWKVRLAISSDQLSEIFSQDARTEALIESVRTVAKCAAASTAPSPSKQNSEDQRSWSSAGAHEISYADQ
ncbi:hypothetical protein CASFOL_041393 [Castilleja foliolosa]|uniref:Uncharacterized protein n=1 Tax=Castilleja foliolosa TaxID=1961234 RepID=A0ABD3BEH5_9LAMI